MRSNAVKFILMFLLIFVIGFIAFYFASPIINIDSTDNINFIFNSTYASSNSECIMTFFDNNIVYKYVNNDENIDVNSLTFNVNKGLIKLSDSSVYLLTKDNKLFDINNHYYLYILG